jgi:hypothetical protein
MTYGGSLKKANFYGLNKLLSEHGDVLNKIITACYSTLQNRNIWEIPVLIVTLSSFEANKNLLHKSLIYIQVFLHFGIFFLPIQPYKNNK